MKDVKQRILVVGDYNRSDFLIVAKLLHRQADFFFIEYINGKHLKNRECLAYGKVLFWKDFQDAYDLLDKIKPTKVVFYFIEAYNHVALIVGCKTRNIPTFHLEHGLRFSPSFSRMVNQNKQPVQYKNNSYRDLFNLSELLDKYRNRKFFLNTITKSPQQEQSFLRQYYEVRSQNSIFDTFQKLRNPLRLPDKYISFSPIIFNYHKEVENLPDHYPVGYSGVPSFDIFFQWKHIQPQEDGILFIDQPLSEQRLFGWNESNKMAFLKQLVSCISETGKKLYIKPHPLNDNTLYKEVSQVEGICLIEGRWDQVIPNISLALGFYSTLLLPFMAMEHVCCFTLEMHPLKVETAYSEFLLSSGACHAAFSFQELTEMIKNRNDWFLKQKEAKEGFIRDWLFCFDGKSSERLEKILLANEVV